MTGRGRGASTAPPDGGGRVAVVLIGVLVVASSLTVIMGWDVEIG
ncbi:hypothetical protein [Streptomyces sp. NPDC047976]